MKNMMNNESTSEIQNETAVGNCNALQKSNAGKPNPVTPLSAALMLVADKVKEILSQEAKDQTLADAHKLNANLSAFDIGELIENEIIATYGAGRMPEFAKLCGWDAERTAYNYLHLYRGAGNKAVLSSHPDLPRTFWYALGSSVRGHDDLMGDMLRRSLLQFPLWRSLNADEAVDLGSTQKQVIDKERLATACQMLNDLRSELREDGILYAFEAFELYAGLPPKNAEAMDGLMNLEPVLTNKSEVHIYNGCVTWMTNRIPCDDSHEDYFYLISLKEDDIEKYEAALRRLAVTWDAISLLTGLPARIALDVGAETPALLDEHRVAPEKYEQGGKGLRYAMEKKKRIKAIRDTTIAADILPATQKVIHGKAEEVLLTDLFQERSIDACLTDPPYGNYLEWRKSSTVSFDEKDSPEIAAQLVASVARILVERKLIKEQFIWMSFCPMDWIHVFVPPLLAAFGDLDIKYQTLVWNKVNLGKPGGYRTFARQAEAILYVNVGDRPLDSVSMGKYIIDREMHPSIFTHMAQPKDGANDFWKPVTLMEHMVALTTGQDDSEEANRQLILDPFCGAGSTGVACINGKRDFRMIDSNEGQYLKAVDNVTIAAAANIPAVAA